MTGVHPGVIATQQPTILPAKAREDANPPLVLIADDDRATRTLLRRVMEQEGYGVLVAATGTEAVRQCGTAVADLILLDYVMPDLDGAEACQQIRALECYRATPILIITGLDDDPSIQRALACGASDYLTKPILLPVLRQRVRHLLASRRAERLMSYLAFHDPLTGLPNRTSFNARLDEVLADGQLRGVAHALMYVDLDQFKIVNDSCGHAAGDEFLRQLSFQLQATLRKDDLLARLGGDEFGILLLDCAIEDACRVAEKLRETVCRYRFLWESRVFTVGASIGVVPIDGDALDSGSLLSAADAACYLAKGAGRNQVRVFRADAEEVRKRRTEMSWVTRINSALEEHRFRLRYQPIASLKRRSDVVDHLEMLIYMIDEHGERVGPDAFIPAAERYDLMPAIDRWVIDTALRFMRDLADRGLPLPCCCINLSGRSLGEEGLHRYIEERLAEHRVPHAAVCFEITETATIAHMHHALALIQALRAQGCRFALDDFGTGLSSFAYLKHLPVDFLKIDGAFVRDIAREPVNQVIVKAINEIAHALGIETIAEFVEDRETLDTVRALGVDYGQGYGIALPTALEDYDPLLQPVLASACAPLQPVSAA
jgi:diguanylate cyclase (GGDEF)-like protein